MKNKRSKCPKSSSLSDTTSILVQGGDTRIAPSLGSNEYDCQPCPDPGLISFASSTASTISEAGLAAADGLLKKIGNTPDPDVFDSEFKRIRKEILSLCELNDHLGLELVLAASGTDAHLIASRLIAPDYILMVQGSETGRGVAKALSGHHFSARSSYCDNLSEGEAVTKGIACPVQEIRLRNTDGNLRPIKSIDHEVCRQVESLTQKGAKVLLVVADISKSGILAPSPYVAHLLKEKFPEKLEILIDACQFRMAPPTLRSYLTKGFMVAFTGSKFLTGPAFSGGLFIPDSVKHVRMPIGLYAYSSCYEWPEGMRSVHLSDKINMGLLLRWEAALTEFRAFKTIPETALEDFLKNFAKTALSLIADNQNLESLTVLPLDRTAFTANQSWDQIQTIFPFRILNKGNHLGLEKTRNVHRLLQQDLSCLSNSPYAAFRCCLGQPVLVSEQDSALRFCASARLAVKGWKNPAKVMDNASMVFRKIDLILQLLDAPEICCMQKNRHAQIMKSQQSVASFSCGKLTASKKSCAQMKNWLEF